MTRSVSRRTVIALVMGCLCTAIPARGSDPPTERKATLQPETRARLTLQSPISSKLSEPDDVVTAILVEPIYVEGELVLPRGVEFHGRIVAISRAKRGQRSSSLSINFERVITPSGAVPISAQVTAIDDWDREETIKADRQGKMKGGRRGEKTIDNVRKGSEVGFSAGIVSAALGGAAGASGRLALGLGSALVATGMVAGLLLTKGREIHAGQGSILRIKFLKAATLPVIQQPGTGRSSGEEKK